jgi:hypothetical protein
VTSAAFAAPARSWGQSVIATVLFINASLCLIYALLLYFGERRGILDFQIPIALLYSLNPPMALACIASPILIFRRSALGLILAWCVAFALFVDIMLSLPATFYYAPLILKIPIDVCLLVTLAVFLIRRTTYQNLDAASYGFPVIARAFGTPQIPPPTSASPESTPLPQSPVPVAAIQDNMLNAQAAQHIKEAHMQSYIRAANFLRLIALIARIITIVLILGDMVLIVFELYLLIEPFFSRSGSPFGRSSEYATILIPMGFLCIVPFVLLVGLFIATYILTALAELLNCQAAKPT